MAFLRRPKGSLLRSKLPKGCELCEKGAELVLLVTGLCRYKCFYCPLSEKKMGRDLVFANELLVKNKEDIISEAKSIDALGAGITGGDPLLVIERTCEYISLLKEEFGPDFNFHLYTASGEIHAISLLEDAGFDEIRFHPFPQYWKRMRGSRHERAINFALGTDMEVGIEIPLLPNRKDAITSLIKWAVE